MTGICRWSHHCSALYFYPSLSSCLPPQSHFSTQSLSPSPVSSPCLLSLPLSTSLSNSLPTSPPLASPSLCLHPPNLSLSLSLSLSPHLPLHPLSSLSLSYYRLISWKCSFPLKLITEKCAHQVQERLIKEFGAFRWFSVKFSLNQLSQCV